MDAVHLARVPPVEVVVGPIVVEQLLLMVC